MIHIQDGKRPKYYLYRILRAIQIKNSEKHFDTEKVIKEQIQQ
jgi:hypothetical protein